MAKKPGQFPHRPRAAARYTDVVKSHEKEGVKIQFYHMVSGHTVSFPAFLTQFSDKYDSKWETYNVYGRMDPIEIFTQTTRTISLGWKCVSANMVEAQTNMKKCSILANMLYPAYETLAGEASYNDISSTQISSPPMFKVKFMNLIANSATGKAPPKIAAGTNDAALKEQHKKWMKAQKKNFSKASSSGLMARLSGLTYEPIEEDGYFIVEGFIFPQSVQLSCELTVHHQHDLGFDANGTTLSPGFPYGLTNVLSKKEESSKQGNPKNPDKPKRKKKKDAAKKADSKGAAATTKPGNDPFTGIVVDGSALA